MLLTTEPLSGDKDNLWIPAEQMPGRTEQPPGFVTLAACSENEEADSPLHSFQMFASGSVTDRNKYRRAATLFPHTGEQSGSDRLGDP